ncbi:MAG: ATP synthase F1 subunit gamma [Bacteroidales bacterium]
MPNLKEVRTRIESVKSTQQITSAMKMVSASKLRKAQNGIQQLRPYAGKLNEILQNVSSNTQSEVSEKFTANRGSEKVLLVAIASNRGLCGGFNSSIAKKVNHLVEGEFKDQFQKGNLKLFCIGRKLVEVFQKRPELMIHKEEDVFDNLNSAESGKIAQQLMDWFSEKKYDQIILVYNSFKNAAVQILKQEQYLPLLPSAEGKGSKSYDYIFEPGKESILSELVPKALKTQIFKVLLDSFAAEQGARMTAMHKATDNAQSLQRELQLAYNKARQAAITNEILEIVSGAEALNA